MTGRHDLAAMPAFPPVEGSFRWWLSPSALILQYTFSSMARRLLPAPGQLMSRGLGGLL